MTQTPKMQAYRKGFTILEISIVIVVIGLITGAVMVGRDMMHNAALNSQIAQLEKFTLATATFKMKYGGLPGDLLNADQYGLNYHTASGSTVNRGDGVLNNHAVRDAPVSTMWTEITFFFIHLTDAGLIEGNQQYKHQNMTYNYCDDTGYYKQFPKMEIGNGGIHATQYRNKIWFGLALNSCSLGAGGGSLILRSTGGVIAPSDAHYIDTKLDDGIPATGTVIAIESWDGTVDNNIDACVVDATSMEYNVNNPNLDCRIWVRSL